MTPDEQLSLMATVVREVSVTLKTRNLRLSEQQQQRVIYFVVKGLQEALRPAGEQRWQ